MYTYIYRLLYTYIYICNYICVFVFVPKQIRVTEGSSNNGPLAEFFTASSLRLLPGDELRVGPVVGRRSDDGSLVFDGMDDWLGELYEGHKPRSFTGALGTTCVQKDIHVFV